MYRGALSIASVCAIALIVAAMLRQQGARAQTAPSRFEALKVLAGTWKAEGEVFDTEFSKAAKDTSMLRNDCWESGEFYACDQIVDGVSRALIVFSLSEKDGTYSNYAIQAGGAPAGPGGFLTIAGSTWTYAPRQNADAKPPFFRTVNVFEGSSTIRYKIEFTRDNQSWTKTREGVERRATSEGSEPVYQSPREPVVPNAAAAEAIGEAIAVPIYGREKIESEKPLRAELTNDVWTVHGTLRCPDGKGGVTTSCDGGTVEVRIAKLDGKILSVVHYK